MGRRGSVVLALSEVVGKSGARAPLPDSARRDCLRLRLARIRRLPAAEAILAPDVARPLPARVELFVDHLTGSLSSAAPRRQKHGAPRRLLHRKPSKP